MTVLKDSKADVLSNSYDDVTITQRFILPQYTTAERDALANPVNGELIYNTTTNQIEGYENGAWADL